mgnify:CR=1 FL=1
MDRSLRLVVGTKFVSIKFDTLYCSSVILFTVMILILYTFPVVQNIHWNDFKEKTSFLTYLQCNLTCREKEMHRRPSNGETNWNKKRKTHCRKKKSHRIRTACGSIRSKHEKMICLRIKWKPCTVSMLICFILNKVCNSLSELKCWNGGNVPCIQYRGSRWQ